MVRSNPKLREGPVAVRLLESVGASDVRVWDSLACEWEIREALSIAAAVRIEQHKATIEFGFITVMAEAGLRIYSGSASRQASSAFSPRRDRT